MRETYLWQRNWVFIKYFPVTLRTALPFPDHHTLQRWPSLPKNSRSHSTAAHTDVLNIDVLNFLLSDNECGLQWVRFCLWGRVWRPWIPQPHISGIPVYKAEFSILVVFLISTVSKERRGSDTEQSNMGHQSSSSMESNLEVKTDDGIYWWWKQSQGREYIKGHRWELMTMMTRIAESKHQQINFAPCMCDINDVGPEMFVTYSLT